MAIQSVIGQQINKLNSLYDREVGSNYDVTAGIYGEEARFKKGIGTALAGSGSDVRGSYNLAPLFSASADFATKRIQARNAREQARMMNLLNITNSMSSPIQALLGLENLRLERDKFNESKNFNLATLIPRLGVNFTNPFRIGG